MTAEEAEELVAEMGRASSSASAEGPRREGDPSGRYKDIATAGASAVGMATHAAGGRRALNPQLARLHVSPQLSPHPHRRATQRRRCG